MNRIALFVPELECGGAQRVFLQLAREFLARGHRVDLVLSQARGGLMGEIPFGVRLVNLGAKQWGFGLAGLGLSSVLRLRAYLRREVPDALMSTLTGANLVAVVARGWAGVSTRLVLREAVSLRNRPGVLWRWMMRRAYPKADAVVTLSPVMRREAMELLGLNGQRVFCIPNPVDGETLRTLSQVPIEDPWFGSEGSSFVLSVGRLTPQKDYETLIRAFAGLVERSGMRLVILGEGPERPELEILVKQLGLQGHVHMPGHEANPWRWMRRARLFVLSSRWEGNPNALLEAISLGLPVVSTEYDESARETVGDRGRVVPVGGVKQMSSAIAEVLESPLPVAAYGGAASVGEAASRYLDILLHSSTKEP